MQAYALVRGASAFLAALTRSAPKASQPRPAAGLESSGLRRSGIENRCPVCHAGFRGARICSRCGADLDPLMLLTVRAWQMREAARQALSHGEIDRALGFSAEAQATQGTGRGESLRLLSTWLNTTVSSRAGRS